MSKTTNNWKSSFAAVRDRFGNSNGSNNTSNNGDNPDELYPFVGMYAVNNGNGSQTLPRYRSDVKMYDGSSFQEETNLSLSSNAVKKTTESMSLSRRNDLGDFWLKTVVDRTKSPMSLTQRLTAAEHLEQLHEPLDDDFFRSGDGGSSGRIDYYRQQSQLDSVAARRNIYLREICRSQSPSPLIAANSGRFSSVPRNENHNGIVKSSTNIIHKKSEGPLNNMNVTAESVNRNGCGRFPTIDPFNIATANYTGKNQNNNNKSNKHNNNNNSNKNNKNSNNNNSEYVEKNTVAERSPSPDTLSDISQSSLLYLPHPRPKHNLHEQMLMISSNNGYSTRTTSATNFPSPNSNSVAMRVSALEKQPGMPKFLSLAGTSANGVRSPKSTVFCTKPVIHLDKNESRQKEFSRTDDSNVILEWRRDTSMPPTTQIWDGHSRSETALTDDRRLYSARTGYKIFENTQSAPKKQINTYNKTAEYHLTKQNDNSLLSNVSLSNTNDHMFESTVSQTFEQKADTLFRPKPQENSTTVLYEKLNNDIRQHNFLYSAATIIDTTPIHQSKPIALISGKLSNMKRFHYPFGTPVSAHVNEAICDRVRSYYDTNCAAAKAGGLNVIHFGHICELINFPIYAKHAVYDACCRMSGLLIDSESADPPVTFQQFSVYWKRMTAIANDEASRFTFTLASARPPNDNLICERLLNENSRNYIITSDFIPMMMDIIDTHPGLHFLKTSPQFHSRYCEMVIVRIFWDVNRSWTGKITSAELRRSKFLMTLRALEDVTDINKVTDFFSYEHFYVTYCKFWELDTDHDMIISRADMREHGGGALTDRIIDRIFSAAVMRLTPAERCDGPIQTMCFDQFVRFLLAEEDKRHPTSIEYWFRCIDLDGDGVISLYEMEYFYSEIEQKLLAKNMETLCLTDVICNLLDSVAPARNNCVTRADLKRSGLSHRFFNTFVNYVKYLDQESSEGEKASVKGSGDREISDWETFCAIEYELLMMDTETAENSM